MQDDAPYDIIIEGGTLIDPAAARNGRFDIAISDGKIAAIESDISSAAAKQRIDASGQLVTPGMIDTHAHVYQYVTGKFGLNADMVGVQSGVTTIVDQGGPSCMTIGGFRHGFGDRVLVARGCADVFEVKSPGRTDYIQ